MITIDSFIVNYLNKILFFLLIFVFSCNTTSESITKKEAEKYVTAGIAHYKDGDNYLAITTWKRALELVPADAEVHNFIGITYHKLNNLDSAIAHFKLATELNRKYYQAFNNLGYAFFLTKDYKDAESCFKSSISIKANYAPAKLNLEKIRGILSRLAVSDSINVTRGRENLIPDKINIAILNLNPINISDETALAFTLRLRSELFRTGNYNLLEREKMQAIFDKQGFQFNGCTSSECLVEAGELLHVEQIIGGSISNVGNRYSIESRLINIETGKVLAAATEDIKGTVRDVLRKGSKKVASKLSDGNKFQ